MTGTYASLL